jgi:hypothetical protein
MRVKYAALLVFLSASNRSKAVLGSDTDALINPEEDKIVREAIGEVKESDSSSLSDGSDVNRVLVTEEELMDLYTGGDSDPTPPEIGGWASSPFLHPTPTTPYHTDYEHPTYEDTEYWDNYVAMSYPTAAPTVKPSPYPTYPAYPTYPIYPDVPTPYPTYPIYPNLPTPYPTYATGKPTEVVTPYPTQLPPTLHPTGIQPTLYPVAPTEYPMLPTMHPTGKCD